MNCGTWFLLHLATMNLSVWAEPVGGRTLSSRDFGGEPMWSTRAWALRGLPVRLCWLGLILSQLGNLCCVALWILAGCIKLKPSIPPARELGVQPGPPPLLGCAWGICPVLSPFSV